MDSVIPSLTDLQGLPVDAPDDLPEGGAVHRERGSRITVDAIVTLNAENGGVEVHACDVSETGLKIETETPLAPGPITVKMIGFPIFSGEVRWSGGGFNGIEFFRPIPWDFLSNWVKTHGFGKR